MVYMIVIDGPWSNLLAVSYWDPGWRATGLYMRSSAHGSCKPEELPTTSWGTVEVYGSMAMGRNMAPWQSSESP